MFTMSMSRVETTHPSPGLSPTVLAKTQSPKKHLLKGCLDFFCFFYDYLSLIPTTIEPSKYAAYTLHLATRPLTATRHQLPLLQTCHMCPHHHLASLHNTSARLLGLAAPQRRVVRAYVFLVNSISCVSLLYCSMLCLAFYALAASCAL